MFPTHALITGASQGIGYACANYLAQKGCAKLTITGRDQAKLQTAKASLEAAFSTTQVATYVCDHSDESSVHNLVQYLEEADALPDAIIANVGVNPVHQFGPKKITTTSASLLLDTFHTNIVNMHLLMQSLLKQYRRSGGRIVLVGSQAYLHGIKGQLAYNVSKAALHGYFSTLVSEYASRGVYCHLVHPGAVENERTEKLRQKIKDVKSVSELAVAECICTALTQSKESSSIITI